MPGIDMVAPFGTSLHVAGPRRATRSRRPSPTSATDPDLHWSVSQPSLEDVFIDLMARSQDNFQ